MRNRPHLNLSTLPFVYALQCHRTDAVLVTRAADDEHHKIVGASPGIERLSQCSLDALVDCELSKLLDAPKLSAPYRGTARLRAGAAAVSVELEAVPVPGEPLVAWLIRPTDVDGCIRRAATWQPETLLLYDDAETLRYVSPKVEQLLGAAPHQLLATQLSALCEADERSGAHRALSAFGTAGFDLADPRPLRLRLRHLTENRWLTVELDLLRYAAPAATPGGSDVVVAHLRDQTERVQKAKEESGRFPVTLAHSSDTEKRRANHDLHDGVGQLITGAAFLAKTVSDRLAQEAHPLVDRASRISRLLVDAIESVRSMSLLFMPLMDRTLGEALTALAEMVSTRCGVRCEIECRGAADKHLTEDVATQLYWIAQEAVMNAVRHADASCIKVSLLDGPQLLVDDDGQGLCSQAALGQGPIGVGLRIMQCRAETIGFRLELTCPSRGTRVRCAAAATPSTRTASSASTSSTQPRQVDSDGSSRTVATCSTDEAAGSQSSG